MACWMFSKRLISTLILRAHWVPVKKSLAHTHKRLKVKNLHSFWINLKKPKKYKF
jgi:hypothetical protein